MRLHQLQSRDTLKQMEVGKVPRKQKTPEKQGFIDSKDVTLPTFHHLGIAVEQELKLNLFRVKGSRIAAK